MANDQNIGGVSVSITGDYSQLGADFDRAVGVAQDAGQKIASALDIAMARADGLTEATHATSDAFVAAAAPVSELDAQYAALFAQGMSLSEAMAAVASASAPAAEVIQQTGEAASQSAGWFEGLANSVGDFFKHLNENGPAFESFANGVGDFISHPLRMAGESTKEFLLAVGPMGAVAVAAGAGIIELGHKITDLVLEEGAAAEATQNLSLRLNLGFEDTKRLSEMAQVAGIDIGILSRVSMRLAEALEDSTGAGKKVADALKGMGIAANDSGDAMLQLLEKLAEIPDSTERINKAHEIMGRGAVQLEPLLANYNELSKAVESLGGHLDHDMVERLLKADDAADRLNISWSHFKESLAVTFAPAVMAGLEALTRLLTGPPAVSLDEQINTLAMDIQGLKASADEATVAVTSMMGGGIVTGQANAGLLAQKEALLEHLQGLQEAAERSKEYNREIAESNAAAADIRGQLAAFDEKTRIVGRMTDGLAVLIAQEKLEQAAHDAVILATAKFNEETGVSITALDYLAIRVGAATLAEEGLRDSMPPVTRELEAADVVSNKLYKSMAQLQEGITAAAQVALDATPWGQMDAALRALGISADDTSQSMHQAKLKAAEFVAENTDGIHEATTAWGVMESEVSRLAKEDLPAAIALQEQLTASMQRMEAPAGQIQASQQKTIDLMIQQRIQAGGLQSIYGSLMQSFQHAYDQLGHSIAASIVQGKSFGQIWHDVLKSLEQAILGAVITSILKMAEAWVVSLVLGKATASAVDAGMVVGQAAIAGAAGFASVMAALPFPLNVAIAPGVAAATTAEVIATYVPIATFETGGLVPEDMMAMVHKGEYISTAAEVTKASVGGGGSGITLNFDGATFNGVPSDEFVRAVMTKAVRKIRLPLGMKVNF